MRTISEFKKWQVEAFQLGRPASNYLIQSPGGAGKSLLIVMLAQADIEDTGNKQLILVPKNHIHHGFFDEEAIEFVLPGQTTISRWVVRSNFCDISKADAKTRMLADFLLADVRALRKTGRLAAIATHKAMVEAWKLLNPGEKQQALRHISFRIDESHHISNVFHDSDLDLYNIKDKKSILEDATRLGKFLNHVLSRGDETVKVHLATATFFRGDRRTILSERFKKEFVHFHLPWDEHFETLGIKELTIDFLNYADDPLEVVWDMVKREPKERHLIIIPALTHRYRTKDTLPKLLEGLRNIMPPAVILDLVTPATQEAHKTMLHKHPDKFKVDVDVMADLLEGYELVEDKANSAKVEQIAERVLDKCEIPEDVEKNDLKDALLHQLLRIANPKGTTLDRKHLLPKGIDAEAIRQQGFDKVWEKLSPVPSVLLHGTENIDAAAIRQLLAIVAQIPSLKEIHAAIRSFHMQTGKRPTFHQAEWMSELGRSASAVDKILRRHFGTTLAKEVGTVLGCNDDLLARTHDLIREYWRKGIRIGNKFGDLPEIGMSSFALNGRLTWNHGTTLAKEVEKILGPVAKPLTLVKVRMVVRKYRNRGIRLHRKFGQIPEIGMSSYNLADRLKRNFNVTLTELVEELN